MSTKLHVSYLLSEAARQRLFVATGEMPERKQMSSFEMADATVEQRALVAEYCGSKLEDVRLGRWWNPKYMSDPKPYLAEIELEEHPSLTMVVNYLARMRDERQECQIEYDAWCRGQCEADLSKKIEALRACLAEGRIGGNYDVDLWRNDLAGHGKRLGIDRSEYDQVRAEYDAWVVIRKAEIEADHAAYQAKLEAEKLAAEQAKLDWINQHGSDHLRRAIEAGHNCARKYLIERAALEYPGFVVDFEDAAEWVSRSCPNIEALDERDALMAAHPEASVEIVWLKAEPLDRKLSERERWEAEEVEPDQREAIAVRDETYGRYWLVK